MKACLLLSLLLLYSCTKYSSVSRDALGIHLQGVEMEISHLNEIKWLVGMKKEEKISQSFTFIVDLPKIKQDDLEYLTQTKDVDSWIIRLIAVKGGEQQDLGSLYALFRPKKISRGVSAGAASSVSIKVFYAAAYASERFRSFKCPAFSHNKRITSMDIKKSDESFELSIQAAVPYLEKSQMIELTPSSFNGGNSLIGEYHVEIAPYNSQKKVIHSTFKRIPSYVVIKEETGIQIDSCAGIHPEIE